MPTLKVEGINLSISKIGEADKLALVFSKEKGKIKVLAKGACRVGSKFSGRLELFAYNEFLLAEGKSFYIVSQCESLKPFYSLRQDPEKFVAGKSLLDLTDYLVDLGQSRQDLFELLLNSLELLVGGVDPEIVFMAFKTKILETEGIFPLLDSCIKCGKKVPAQIKEIKFSTSLGGVICSSCGQSAGFVKIPYELVQMIALIKNTSLPEIPNLKIAHNLRTDFKAISNYLISEHIGKDISKLI